MPTQVGEMELIMHILDSVVKYISFLEREYSLYVSVHCLQPPLDSLMPEMGKYNTHYHPYCLYFKSHPKLWEKCHAMQSKVIRRGGTDIFYGECCFGVCEYVIPILHKEKNIGFISVSGFVNDEEKLQKRVKKISDEYGLDYSELGNASKLLSQNPPDEAFLADILCHIADILSVYADVLPQRITGNNNTNYIYSNAMAYIHEHYTEDIRVDDIALFCKCSRSYITKLFKINGDIGIKKHITNLRMQEAKKLLKNTNKSVKEIAFDLGYNDSNYFSNIFYKNTGTYPREFRRS